MAAIYKRELKSYFSSMTGPIFIAFLLLMTGIYTIAMNLVSGYPNFEYTLSSIVFYFLLVIPILTMRSYAEDMHSRTDQLLFSLPMKLSHIVLAKYFAMLTVLAIPCAVMCLYPVLLSFYGTVNFASAYGAILCLFLLGAALIAIGSFFSSLTESQLIAAVLTVAVFLVLYLISGIASLIPQTSAASLAAFLICAVAIALLLYVLTKNTTVSVAVGAILGIGIVAAYLLDSAMFAGSIQKVLNELALFGRINNFLNGIFDITSLVYYASVAGLFVFFTVQSMEKKRWA